MRRFLRKAPGRLPLLAAAVALGSCGQGTGNNVAQNQIVNETSPLPQLPVAEPPMDRAALLLATVGAASAIGLGRDDSDEQRRLDGNAFELRIRFGCGGASPPPQGNKGSFAVRYEAKDRTLRIRAAPDLTLEDPVIKQLASEPVEAVEGFWLRRPWLLEDGCPAALPEAQADVPVQEGASRPEDDTVARAVSAPRYQRIGVAQFFTDADSRTGRRDKRPYETTKILAEDEQPSRDGYNLVLSGRLRKLASGRVIACQVQSRDIAPDCVISVEFDRARIENPETRQTIAEWGN